MCIPKVWHLRNFRYWGTTLYGSFNADDTRESEGENADHLDCLDKRVHG